MRGAPYGGDDGSRSQAGRADSLQPPGHDQNLVDDRNGPSRAEAEPLSRDHRRSATARIRVWPTSPASRWKDLLRAGIAVSGMSFATRRSTRSDRELRERPACSSSRRSRERIYGRKPAWLEEPLLRGRCREGDRAAWRRLLDLGIDDSRSDCCGNVSALNVAGIRLGLARHRRRDRRRLLRSRLVIELELLVKAA